MTLLVLVVIVLVVCALLCVAVDKIRELAPFNRWIQAIILIIGAIVILQRAGLLNG